MKIKLMTITDEYIFFITIVRENNRSLICPQAGQAFPFFQQQKKGNKKCRR